LVLHHYFPEKYLFYRVSKLEKEIFEGFEFFSDIIPEFDFPFTKIGKTGFEKYLVLNSVLLAFGKLCWPDVANLQYRMERFLYDHFAHFFVNKSDYNRYWVCNTIYHYWKGES